MENTEGNCEKIWKILKKVGWIVQWYGKYGRKIVWILKWYEKYLRKEWKDMGIMKERWVE